MASVPPTKLCTDRFYIIYMPQVLPPPQPPLATQTYYRNPNRGYSDGYACKIPRSPPQGDDAPHRMIHRMIHRRALLAPLCDTGTTEAVILANTRTPL